MVGRFADGQGVFHGDDEHAGRSFRMRFEWTDITPTSARWAQRFSFDDGQTWDAENWVMTLTREG